MGNLWKPYKDLLQYCFCWFHIVSLCLELEGLSGLALGQVLRIEGHPSKSLCGLLNVLDPLGPCYFIFLFMLFNLLGWHWLIRLYRFQVYISMVQGLYMAVCSPPKVKSCSVTIYLAPFTLYHSSVLFTLITTIPLSGSMSLALYPTGKWNYVVLSFFLTDLFHLA